MRTFLAELFITLSTSAFAVVLDLSVRFFDSLLCAFSESCFHGRKMEQPQIKVIQLLSAVAMIGAITYQVFV